MSEIAGRSQQLAVGTRVELFEIDGTALGGEIYRFTSTGSVGGSVQFNGNTYESVDLEAEGFEWTGKGALPQPRMRITKSNAVIAAAVESFKGLRGAVLTRTRTLAEFLDGEAGADPTQTWPVDIYRIDQLKSSNKYAAEFLLAAISDQQGRKLPKQQVLRGICPLRYRVYDAAADPEQEGGPFTYPTVNPCPYTEQRYFDANGNPVSSASEDRCNKQLRTGCLVRFEGDPLPYGGFPGLAQVKS
nr:phage minor tail protein L [bacterium]